MNKSRFELINIIGIGAFVYLSISAFYVLIAEVLRDLFILLETDSNLNFWITETLVLVLFFITSYFVVKRIGKEINRVESKTRRVFLILFVGFFVVQIFQFLYAYYGTNYVVENYTEKITDFYSYIEGDSSLGFYDSLFGICKYLVFGLIILFGKKLLPTTYKNNA